MKIILAPTFMFILALVYSLLTLISYILAFLLVLIYFFRILPYSEFANNKNSLSVVDGLQKPYYDKNPLDTFLRVYNNY